MESQLYPVLQMSCNPQNKDALHVLDEGMILWLNMVQQSAFLTESLLLFFPNLLDIVKANRDDRHVLRKSAHVCEGMQCQLWASAYLVS